MSVLSKPLLFSSCHTKGISQNYRRDKTLNNVHFWIVKDYQVIEPTDIMPYETPARSIYLPFTADEQKELYEEWMDQHCKMWGCSPHEVMMRVKYWQLPFDKGGFGNCWVNALHYKLNHGGEIVAGLMGYYDKKLGYVNVDYGY